MSIVNEALRLAGLGYRVFPCVPGEKRPLTEHGVKDATTDEDQIGEWWTEHPDANIGVSTDGLLVVDVDPIDGEQNPWCSEVEDQADLMQNATTISPRRGLHFWFRGGDFRNTASKLAKNVDTRGNGGYVLAPPSRTPDGQYHWSPFCELQHRPEDLTEPPRWLVRALNEEQPAQPKAPLNVDDVIPDGQRNATLARMAGGMRRMGMGEEEILAGLRAANRKRCSPPLDDKEVSQIAWSVSRYEPDQVTQAEVEGWYDRLEIMPATAKPDPGNIPRDLLTVPGLIGDVMAFNLRTAYKPQPELALAAGLSLMAVLTGRNVEDDLGTRTNLYCLGLCDSGGGKEHARKVNKELLRIAGLENLIGPEGLGSSAGLLSAVNREPPVVLLQVDEIGRILRTMNNPDKTPHLYNIITVFLRLFTSSNSVYKGEAYADVKKVPTIDQPHCVLYGTTVPKSFFESLTRESLSDGFVARMLVFEASNKDPDPQRVEKQEYPPELVEQVQWWASFRPGGLIAQVNPQPHRLSTLAADDIFVELESLVRQKRREEDDAALWTRAVEKARKLALLYTLSADREAVEVTRDAAEWGCQLVTHLTEKIEVMAEKWVSDGKFDESCRLIYRIVEAAGASGISRNQLSTKTRAMRPRERQEALQSLMETGEIISEQVSTTGRPAIVYKTRRAF